MNDLVELSLVIGIRTLLAEGEYQVEGFKITVSYDFSLPHFNLSNVPLGQRRATFVVVSWHDDGEKIRGQLTGRTGNGDHLRPLLKALEKVNKLFLAINLSWIGHAYSDGARTVGKDDIWMEFCSINSEVVPGLTTSGNFIPFTEDLDSVTEKVTPHIDEETFPVARRFIRCFELIGHGFYTESLIVSFSILDDLVQTMLHNQLELKGMADKKQREALLRGIEKNRLKIYLGQLLYLIANCTVDELWENASTALTWLNGVRNKIAHGGHVVGHGEASKAIYVCVKTLSVLSQRGLIDFEVPSNMYRQAQIYASWTDNPPNWVPPNDEAILDIDFSSVYPEREL